MPFSQGKPGFWLLSCIGIAVPSLCTLLSWPFREPLGEAGVLLIYLLGVFLVATRFGRYPSVLAALLSASGFAYYFARPIFSLAISDAQNVVGLVVMLVVASVTSRLMEQARGQALLAGQRERNASALYGLSKALAAARQEDEILRAAVKHIHAVFGVHNTLLLADDQGKLAYPKAQPLPSSLTGIDLEDAQRSFEQAWKVRLGMDHGRYKRAGHFPLVGSENTLGVLVVEVKVPSGGWPGSQDTFFESFVSQIIQSLERARMAEQAKAASIQAEAENLRNALLSAISHDLRTPLTTIVGASSALLDKEASLSRQDWLELHGIIQEEALRMSDLMHKILDMARFSSGKLALNRQWNNLEEIIGSALNRLEHRLKDRPIMIRLPENLPLVFVDAVLLQQVLLNLLDNAVKYTPEGSPVNISIDMTAEAIHLSVADVGEGVPAGSENHLFEKFYRLRPESPQSGVGLGLAICKAIVEAHGGQIGVMNSPAGGAVFTVSLPKPGQPPSIESAEADEA